MELAKAIVQEPKTLLRPACEKMDISEARLYPMNLPQFTLSKGT